MANRERQDHEDLLDPQDPRDLLDQVVLLEREDSRDPLDLLDQAAHLENEVTYSRTFTNDELLFFLHLWIV